MQLQRASANPAETPTGPPRRSPEPVLHLEDGEPIVCRTTVRGGRPEGAGGTRFLGPAEYRHALGYYSQAGPTRCPAQQSEKLATGLNTRVANGSAGSTPTG